MTIPRVLALYREQDICFWWRIQSPFDRLFERGHGYAYAHLDDDPNVAWYADLFDAVVLPRMSWEERHTDHGRWFIDRLHAAGLCVIYEVDDDVFGEHINQRLHVTLHTDATLERLEQRRLERLAAMRLCDGVTVSSRRLASVVSRYVDTPVAVIPNAIDSRWWRQAAKGWRKRVYPEPVVGWAGGARPDEDLTVVAEAWRRIAERYPAVRFVTIGWPSDEFGRVPPDRLTRLPWMLLEEYTRALAQFDVACCSVADRPFNRAKTAIKAWEAALSGAAVVATPTLYGRVVTHGEDGLLAETADEWEAALSRLLDDPAERRRLWRNQRRRVAAEHSLDKNLWRWPAGYATIIEEWRARRAASRILLPRGYRTAASA